MPTVRKVTAEEAALWTAKAKAPKPYDDRYEWVERAAVLFVHPRERAVTCAPRVGDVLRLRAAEGTAVEKITGVVLVVHPSNVDAIRQTEDGGRKTALLFVLRLLSSVQVSGSRNRRSQRTWGG